MTPSASLIQRFLHSAHQRLTALLDEADALHQADDIEATIKALGKTLHTLKGESRMLGISEVSEIVHAVESMLFSHLHTNAVNTQTTQRLQRGIDAALEAINHRQSGQQLPETQLQEVLQLLHQENANAPTQTPPTEASTPSPSPTPPTPSVEPPSPSPHLTPSAPTPPAAEEASTPQPKGTTEHSPTLLQISLEQLEQMTAIAADCASLLASQRRKIQALQEHQHALRSGLENLIHALKAPENEKVRFEEPHKRPPYGDLELTHGRNIFLDVLNEHPSPPSQTLEQLTQALAQSQAKLQQLAQTQVQLSTAQDQLRTALKEARLQPLKSIFSAYPSFVRRLERETGKQASLTLEDNHLQIDQAALAPISELCLHILQNAVWHGIETPEERVRRGKPSRGQISLIAEQVGELIKLEISDDGAGINREKVRQHALKMGLIQEKEPHRDVLSLIFAPQLSTAPQLSSGAGRGIGLHIVQSLIERLGGSVSVHSQPHKGTTFTLYIPVHISLRKAMLVEVSDRLYALPSIAIQKLLRCTPKEIIRIEGEESVEYNGQLVPLRRLCTLLGLTGLKDLFTNRLSILLLRAGDAQGAVLVDRVLGERELLCRPLGTFLGRPFMTNGAALLEDGQLAQVLHVPELLRGFQRNTNAYHRSHHAMASDSIQAHILYAEDSPITREYAAGLLREHGYLVTEAADGAEALTHLQETTFDLLLTDLQMPHIDGFQLLKHCRQELKLTLPVIVLSTIDSPEARQMAQHVGADAYLVKSQFSAESLLSTIHRHLKKG